MDIEYSLGWDLRNEYIDKFSNIMKDYDAALKAVKDIDKEAKKIKTFIEKSANSEVDSKFEGLDKTFDEKLPETINDINNRRRDSISKLEIVKSETREKIDTQKKELESKLEEIKAQLDVYRINFKLADTAEKKAEIREKYDNAVLEARKIRVALEWLAMAEKAIAKSDKLSKEDILEIPKVVKEDPEVEAELPKEEVDPLVEGDDTYIKGVEPPVQEPIPVEKEEDKAEDEEVKEEEEKITDYDFALPQGMTETPTDDFGKLTFDQKLAEYNDALLSYNSLLDAYNDKLDKFHELEIKFVNGEIPFEGEYEEISNNIVELYNYVLSECRRLEGERNNLETIREEEIAQKEEELSRLEKIADADESFTEKVNTLRGEIERLRGTVIDKPLGPQEPAIAMEKENQEEEKKVEEEFNEPIKIVKITPWQWIKDHKKQILIALGLTALAISLIVLVTQLLPAITAAMQASHISHLFGAMTANGQAWFTAGAQQGALHAANINLANQIAQLTGMTTHFAKASGIWTMGGQSLAAAASSAAANAAAANAAVGAISGATLATGLGGLGLLGGGLLTTNHSNEYREINKKIKEFKKNAKYYTDEKFTMIAYEINNAVERSSELSKEERKKLHIKLSSILRKKSYLFEEQKTQEVKPVVENQENIEPSFVDNQEEFEPEFEDNEKSI